MDSTKRGNISRFINHSCDVSDARTHDAAVMVSPCLDSDALSLICCDLFDAVFSLPSPTARPISWTTTAPRRSSCWPIDPSRRTRRFATTTSLRPKTKRFIATAGLSTAQEDSTKRRPDRPFTALELFPRTNSSRALHCSTASRTRANLFINCAAAVCLQSGSRRYNKRIFFDRLTC